jgi:hypothetical protein
MQAVESLLSSFPTKEERAKCVKDSLGTNPANRPFYWKTREDGKKLVCYFFFGYFLLTGGTMILQLFQSDVITYTLSSHFKDIKNASEHMLKLYPIGALILSIQAVISSALSACSNLITDLHRLYAPLHSG